MIEEEYQRFLRLIAPIVPAIVPCKSGTKIPAVRWKDHPAATTYPDLPGTTARAILTGERSGGLAVIDVDTKLDGFRSLESLEQELGQIPATLTVRSPSGGLHIYLRAPGWRTVKAIRPGIDIRGEGGIAIVPGSLHPNGGHYMIEDSPE